MSLRRKLILLFLGLVVLPVVLLAYLLVDVSRDARHQQAEAELRAGMLSVHALYELAGQVAPQEADRVARRLTGPIRADDAKRTSHVLEQELDSRVIAAIKVLDRNGKVVEEVGPKLTLAKARSPIRSSDGRRFGTVEVMTIDSRSFLSRIEAQTAQTAAIVHGGEVVASTDPVSVDAGDVVTSTPNDLTSFGVDASTGDDLGAALDLSAERGDVQLLLLSSTDGGMISDPVVVIATLACLLIVALSAAALMLNRLRRRLNDMLEMTRRIGQGDFSGELAEDGGDEMAELAQGINRMRTRISGQMEELQSQRRELDQSVRRLGEAFASGLDRDALLEVLIETAKAACRARCGQVLLERDGEEPAVISAGDDCGELTVLLSEASALVGHVEEPAVAAGGDGATHAIAAAMADPRRPEETLCVVSVAREGEEFTEAEREALQYLIGQCAISIENIALHEQLGRQAVTDDLTGLANHRSLNAWIEREIQRVRRYEEPLSVLMIDVDDFKRINDTYGHPQGDRVLIEVAGAIRGESREVDEAARYGGDEFVLALPDTDPAGAAEVAERIRRRVSELTVPGDADERLSVSIGVAGTSTEMTGAAELVTAADDALYRAKAAGKDRVATNAGT